MEWKQLIFKVKLARELLRADPVEIRLNPDEVGRSFHALVTRRHRRYPFIRAKSFGLALFPVPEKGARLYTGKKFQAVRTNSNKARGLGYTVRRIDPAAHIDEMLAIHASAETRQGKSMNADYLDRDKVAAFVQANPGHWYGAFDKDGRLVAYCFVLTPGEVFLFSRLLGDAKDLPNGVMWLLLSRIVEILQNELEVAPGRQLWCMYDTYIGGDNGLREFKKLLGFRPCRCNFAVSPTPVLRDAAAPVGA
jgi:hypothetical protein